MEVNGVDLFVKRVGGGEPIVFLHGGPGSEHQFFLPHMEELADQYELVFYDQGGCGLSGEPAEYSMQGEVDTLEKLRQELGYEKWNLFGESWGSVLALLYATQYPEHVEKIILTAAIGASAKGFISFSQELEKRVTEEDVERLTYIKEKVEQDEAGIGDILEVLDPYYVYSPEALERKASFTINHQANQTIGKDIQKNYDVRDRLSRLQDIPVLVAQGEQDIITPDHIQSLLIDHIPRARLHTLRDCGHWTVVEKPEEIKQITRKFIG